MRNWLWYLTRNSAVSRACSLVLPSPRPDTTRFPAKIDAPLLPTRPLHTISDSMPWRFRLSAAVQPAAPPPTTTTSVDRTCILTKLLIFQVNTAPLALTGVFLHHAVSIWAGG